MNHIIKAASALFIFALFSVSYAQVVVIPLGADATEIVMDSDQISVSIPDNNNYLMSAKVFTMTKDAACKVEASVFVSQIDNTDNTLGPYIRTAAKLGSENLERDPSLGAYTIRIPDSGNTTETSVTHVWAIPAGTPVSFGCTI